MRGIWVATVGGNDFPQGVLGAAAQEKALDDIVANVKAAGLNTIFFQVRPSSDAYYKSDIYPWASYLTGTQGKSPGYDPLERLVEKAHGNGIAVQAWINPFRVGLESQQAGFAASNPARLHPGWVVRYTDQSSHKTMLWYNPGLPEVRDMVVRGVAEIVRNYRVDGIHIDDYYYPYSVAYYNETATQGDIKFDDSAAYASYGGGKNIDDWRRSNIDETVKSIHDTVKSINGAVQFGVAPFGIWATKDVNSLGAVTTGLSSYKTLYSDSRLWVQSHWVDYVCPQLYWGFDTRYAVMADWWDALCSSYGVALYIGHSYSTSSSGVIMGTPGKWTNAAGVSQLQYAQGKASYRGSVFYGYGTLGKIKPLLQGIYY